MSHAKSLRAIGQTLQTARVTTFKLEKHADLYRLWIANRLFCFGPADISRLDAQARKRRANHPSANRPSTALPSSYVLWAVILTELRFALFVSCGRAVLLFWSTNESPENGTIEFLQLKNCGRWVSTGVCYGRAMTFSRGWILDSRLETIEIRPGKAKYGSASSAASVKLKARPLRFRKHV